MNRRSWFGCVAGMFGVLVSRKATGDKPQALQLRKGTAMDVFIDNPNEWPTKPTGYYFTVKEVIGSKARPFP